MDHPSNSGNNLPIPRRQKKPKKLKTASKCAICGQKSLYKFYNAQCCEACKQFFRRSIKERREYCCWKDGRCNLKDLKCQSCRLDQCLLAGMLFKKVRVAETESVMAQGYARHLLMRKKRAAKLRNVPIKDSLDEGDTDLIKISTFERTGGKESTDFQRIAFSSREASSDCLIAKYLGSNTTNTNCWAIATLCQIEDNVEKFLGCERQFKEGFLEQFDSVRKLLVGTKPGLICKFERFTVRSLWEPDMPFFSESNVLQKGFCEPKNNRLLMDLLTATDLCRTMPFFDKLDIEDQICLVNYMGVPLIELLTRYECSRHNLQSIIKPNGCEPIRLFCNKSGWYSGDTTIYKMAYRLFCLDMKPFNEVKLSREEYLLVRAILIAHPGTPGLSRHAVELLQHETEHYARALMRHVQYACGSPGAGARRFAEIALLAECVFRSAQRHREFSTYLAMVPDQGKFHARTPGCFISMFMDF